MPRDNDKNNNSRGRRDRPSGGKGRSGAARGPEKKFAKRGFAGKSERRASAPMPAIATTVRRAAGTTTQHPAAILAIGRARHASTATTAPAARSGRSSRAAIAQNSTRGDRPKFDRDRAPRGERSESRAEGRFPTASLATGRTRRGDRKAARSAPYTPRGDRPKFERGDRPKFAAIVRRVASAVKAAPKDVSRIGNSATGRPAAV